MARKNSSRHDGFVKINPRICPISSVLKYYNHMIVDKMYPWDVCSELEHDSIKVNYMLSRYKKQAVKYFKGCITFPAWVYYVYTTSDTLNTYILYFHASSKEEINNPESGHFAFLDLKEKTIMRTYPLNFTDGRRRVLQEFRYHFFDRYRERALKNNQLSLAETACRFFTKDARAGILLDINENVQKSLKKYSEHAKNVILFPSGIGLGQTANLYEGVMKGDELPPDAKLMTWFYMSTFVSTEMLFENQKDELSQLVFQNIEDIKREVNISPDNIDAIVMLNSMQKDSFKKYRK